MCWIASVHLYLNFSAESEAETVKRELEKSAYLEKHLDQSSSLNDILKYKNIYYISSLNAEYAYGSKIMNSVRQLFGKSRTTYSAYPSSR